MGLGITISTPVEQHRFTRFVFQASSYGHHRPCCLQALPMVIVCQHSTYSIHQNTAMRRGNVVSCCCCFAFHVLNANKAKKIPASARLNAARNAQIRANIGVLVVLLLLLIITIQRTPMHGPIEQHSSLGS